MSNIIIKQASEIEDNITFEKDLFNRKPFWESLANLILNSWNESLVISINANRWEWKSTFLKMWKNYLLNDKNTTEKPLNVIYFDSFKNDFIEDPFLALLSEILNYKKWTESIFESVKGKSKNVLKAIIPMTWKIWLRFLMWWDIESVEDKLEEFTEWELVNFVNKTLEDYLKKEESIKIFKESIEKIILEKGQLIFIIDELDRCRPDFALRLLERIKHFFDIKWLYFVLWINKEQITKYIKKIYWDIDWEEYLQKFIDIETILPKNISERDNDYEKYVNNLIDGNYKDIFDKHMDKKSSIKKLLIFLSKHYNISFRELEKNINYLALFYKSLSSDKHLNMFILTIILIFIRIKDINLYWEIKQGFNKKDDIIIKLNLSDIWEPYNNYINDELNFIFDAELTDEMKEKYNWLWRYGIYDTDKNSRKRILKHHFDILDAFNI